MDVEGIEPGEDFMTVVDDHTSQHWATPWPIGSGRFYAHFKLDGRINAFSD
jgi:hypothetical protein